MTGFDGEKITGTVIGYRWWDLWTRAERPLDKVATVGPTPRGCLFGAWSGWGAGENHATCLNPYQASLGRVLSGGIIIYSRHRWDNHSAPDPECSCGFWGFWEAGPWWRTTQYDDLWEDYLQKYDAIPILGVIEGWGNTLKGNLGFRCEKAKITALLAPIAAKRMLSEAQPQAMLYSNAAAMFAEHPSGIMRQENLLHPS